MRISPWSPQPGGLNDLLSRLYTFTSPALIDLPGDHSRRHWYLRQGETQVTQLRQGTSLSGGDLLDVILITRLPLI